MVAVLAATDGALSRRPGIPRRGRHPPSATDFEWRQRSDVYGRRPSSKGPSCRMTNDKGFHHSRLIRSMPTIEAAAVILVGEGRIRQNNIDAKLILDADNNALGGRKLVDILTTPTTSGSDTSRPRLGVFLKTEDLPSEAERRSFFAKFGCQHCFITTAWWNKLHVFFPAAAEKQSFDSLAIDYLYAPDHWKVRLTDDQLRNALLSLRHWESDFLVVSASLSELP